MALQVVIGIHPMECVLMIAHLSKAHHAEWETHDYQAPTVAQYTAHLANSADKIGSLDKIAPWVADAHWGYILDPQDLHRRGLQLLHRVWTLCEKFVVTIATMHAKLVPATCGAQQHRAPYALYCPDGVAKLSGYVDAPDAQYVCLLLTHSRAAAMPPP